MNTRPEECGYCNQDHGADDPCPELDGSDHEGIPRAARDAVADATGYEADDDMIRFATAEITGRDTDALEEELGELVEEFEGRGGRGVDLAERIEVLRIGLAARPFLEGKALE